MQLNIYSIAYDGIRETNKAQKRETQTFILGFFKKTKIENEDQCGGSNGIE